MFEIPDIPDLVGVGADHLVRVEGDHILGLVDNLHLGVAAAPEHVGAYHHPFVLGTVGLGDRIACGVAVHGFEGIALTGETAVGGEVIGIVELDGLRVIVVAEHEIFSDRQLHLSAFRTIEIEAVAASATDRVEIYTHAVRIGSRSVPPVEFHLHGHGMRMIPAELLVNAAGEQ